jgi:O-antigen/teichoic acid export membrane protein
LSLKKNLFANYLGQGWTALMGLAFVPMYIRYLGIEAYGLIGIFAMLQIWLTLLDMGMTPTLSREMSRFTGAAHDARSIRDLLRSVEVIALGVTGFIAVGIWTSSTWLAIEWLRVEELPVSEVAQAFNIMGVVTAFRFVEGIYRSSIVGLQRQVLFNVINSTMATIRGLGAVCILAWVSPNIEAFFLWQGLISLFTLLLFAKVTYATLPRGDHPGRFSTDALKGVWRYAAGMIGISFLALLLTQVDKILLSKLLSLSDYGYYTLASVVAGAIYMLVSPITQAFFPHFSELHASGNQAQLSQAYHMGAQLVSVLMGSAALVLVAFSEVVLRLWTQDAGLAARSARLLSIMCIGNLLNGLMWIPYQTQLAHGWTGLSVRINIVSVVLIVPAILWVVPRYGSEGAAWVWLSLNAGYVLLGIHFMYRKILTSEKWRWYAQDVIKPLFFAALPASMSAWLMPEQMSTLAQLAWLFTASGLTLTSAALSARSVRESLLALIRGFYRTKMVEGTA